MAAQGEKPARVLNLVLIGIALPIVFGWLNGYLADARRQTHLMAALVFEVGLMGPLCAHGVRPRWLMWLVYGWIWLLLDLQVVALAFNDFWAWETITLDTLPIALLEGQIGLVVVWATLGQTRWTKRWPAALLLVVALLVPIIWHRTPATELLILLVLQNGALFLICMWLRWLQFSLGRHAVRRGEPERIEDFNALRDLRENQFQMRDVLVWTTVLAIALGAARALDYWSSSVAAFEQAKAGIARYGWSIAAMPTPTAAICTAMILLIAIWSALGAGCAMWRWSILLTVVCAVTMAHGLFDFFQKTRVWGWTPLWRGWEVFFDFQQPLMIWDGLAGGMLFAALLMFRALGYRLVRSRGIAVEENKVAAELQG